MLILIGLGTCASFEESQIGGERFNIFEGCPEAKTCTLVLRGGAEQFIAEVILFTFNLMNYFLLLLG